jgi:hypothetical protein
MGAAIHPQKHAGTDAVWEQVIFCSKFRACYCCDCGCEFGRLERLICSQTIRGFDSAQRNGEGAKVA